MFLPQADLARRRFLKRCLRGVSAACSLPLAGLVRGQNAPRSGGDLHIHPHYREKAPLDSLLLKIGAAFDNFAGEKQHDQIAAVLAQWTAGLRASPANLQAIANALAPEFLGSSLRPTESRSIRQGAQLEVRDVTYAMEPTLSPDAFLRDLRAALSNFSELITAEFQITRIRGAFETRVRYELAGTGPGFHREQRVGFWDLEWRSSPAGEYRLHRWRAVTESRSRSVHPWYTDIASQALGQNPSFVEQLAHGVDDWRSILDGACGIDIYGHNGVSVGDIDGDGFDDIYVCQPAGLPNRLYRNRGDGTFEDVTATSGLGILENTACALFADFDNDGHQDLVVVRANGPLLFLNQGNGNFRLKTDAFQFANAPQGTFTGAAAADYDRDGWLDIYFCLYVYYQGTDQYKYPSPYYAAENGPPNFMFRNNRDGTFRDVTAKTGLDKNNTRYSFCCGWGDSDRDGWPDLYVVNDFGRKNLYRNNGDGTFTDVAIKAGVEDVGAGMGLCWFDYDNDGSEDVYVADMWTAAGERISSQEDFKRDSSTAIRALYQKHAMGNSLFRNRRDGTFEDSTGAARVGNGRWAWSCDAWDFDHDGFPDLYVVNGMISGPIREDLNSFFWRQVVANSPDEPKPSESYEQGWNAVNELIRADYTWSGYERNVFFANNSDGTFSDVSGAVGLDFIEDGRSFALADINHDGRLEVVLKNRNGPQVRMLKNIVAELPPSIAFRLRGVKSNRDAIGAVVTIETEAGRQTRSLQAGSGFLSQHSKEIHFGLGAAKGPVSTTIRWPSGLVQQLRDLPMNHRIWVEEGADPKRMEPFGTASTPSQAVGAATSPLKQETWLLAPVPAPDFTPRNTPTHLPVSQIESEDTLASYNILYRRLFDRHRDLARDTSFLVDERGDIVKIYHGPVEPARIEQDALQIPRTPAERLAKALPFPGNSATYEFGRNHLSLGSAFFERGYYDPAEVYFRRALKDDPSSAEARYGLGSVFLKQEKLSDARANFEQAAKLNSSYPETRPNAWNNLGLLATREGRTSDAVACFEEALRVNPDHWIATENLGNAYRQQRRWPEAQKMLERAVQLRPQDPEANYSLAMVFAQTDDADRAFEYLQRALKLRPTYPEALNNLGVLYLRTNRREEAVKTFEECIRVAPGFDQSYLNLSKVYAIEEDRQKARSILLDLLKQHPEHPVARQALEQQK